MLEGDGIGVKYGTLGPAKALDNARFPLFDVCLLILGGDNIF